MRRSMLLPAFLGRRKQRNTRQNSVLVLGGWAQVLFASGRSAPRAFGFPLETIENGYP